MTKNNINFKIKYQPETKEELIQLVNNKKIQLGEIDTSKITDMSKLFENSMRNNFTGIENWNVSNVKNMSDMFHMAVYFNQNISNWNVSNVENMGGMFWEAASFNQNIGSWNVSNVKNMMFMFAGASSFNQDLSRWNVSNVYSMDFMFIHTPIEKNPPLWYEKLVVSRPFFIRDY